MATLPKPFAMAKPAKSLPAPNSDCFEIVETPPAEELAVGKAVTGLSAFT